MAAAISIVTVVPEYQTILAESSKLLATITDVSAYVVKGTSAVNYPTLSPRTAQNKAIGVALTKNDAAYGNDSFNMDKVIGDAFGVNLHQEEQNIFRNLEDSTKETLRAMGLAMDEVIFAAALAAAAHNVAPTADMYADCVDLAKALDEAKVPADGRVLWVSPADYAKLLKTQNFVRFDAKGDGSAISTGIVGSILGFTVVKSTAVTTSLALHSKGIAYAIQGDTKMLMQPDALGVANIYSISDLFGCKATQSGAFIVKLAA